MGYVACAINLGSSVIITGGENQPPTRVSQYNEAGLMGDLPGLQQGRREHGCSFYNNDEGTKTFLVSGGWDGGNPLDSTELLVETASAWVYSGQLPHARRDPRAANI